MAARKKTASAVITPPAVQLIRASDVKPEAMEFLWLDRIPKGTLTMIGGRPGQGKSLLSTYLAAEVTRGGGAVVMSNPEDALAWVKMPRLLAAGADTRLVHFWPGKLRIPDDVDQLEELVNFHGVELVTIDPIAKHIRSKDPGTALESLVAMAERTGVAVLGIHHLNKRLPKDAHPQDAFGGASGGWIGTVRYAHVLGPHDSGEEDTRYLAQVKSNHGRDDVPSIEFFVEGVEVDLPNGEVIDTAKLHLVNKRSKVSGKDIVHFKGGSGFKHQGGEKMAVAGEFLALLLMHGPVKANTVYDKGAEAGVSKATLRRAADEAEIVKKRIGFGEGSHITWALPPGHPALAMVPSTPSKGKGKAPADPAEAAMEDVDAFIAGVLSGGDDDDDS
jgi:putative DNA primase/helicase